MIHHATRIEKPARRPGVMERREYRLQAASLAKRGQDAPTAKLLDIDVISIRSAVRQRQNLLTYIRDNLSNDALCKQYGVSENVITRVVKYENYGHIA